MPIHGGTSGKLGDRYEVLWVVDNLLRILDGKACSLTYEPIDSAESMGIEFVSVLTDGTREFWSIKRQTTASGWSFNALTSAGSTGRSILGDLLTHVRTHERNRGVFASQLGAPELSELGQYSATPLMLQDRLKQSKSLYRAVTSFFSGMQGGWDQISDHLARIRVHTADEELLRQKIDTSIQRLIRTTTGDVLDADLVRELLASLALDRLNRPTDRKAILEHLGNHGFQLTDWSQTDARQRLDQIGEEYIRRIQELRIDGVHIPLAGEEEIQEWFTSRSSEPLLVVGHAGCGKSSSLAEAADHARNEGIPIATVRFDSLPQGITTTRELGKVMNLQDSPVIVLGGLALGATSLLILDQLDAVSLVSGRRAELWGLFERILAEARQTPGMMVIIGCRAFDLEHDHRMRSLREGKAPLKRVNLKPLLREQVNAVVERAGIDSATIEAKLCEVLTLPLHLAMYLRLAPNERPIVRNRQTLFDHFWGEAEQRVTLKLGKSPNWNRAIDRVVTWLSNNQELAAPEHVLEDEFAADARAMASENILVHSEGRYRFFHESFFDYAFARRFITREEGLVEVLTNTRGDQQLFRRAQVRQVLTYLRSSDERRYLREIEELLKATSVRFHIKRSVMQWMNGLPDPSLADWKLLKSLDASHCSLHSHFRNVTWGSPHWFDVMDAAGDLDAALAGENEIAREECIAGLRHPTLAEQRSKRIAQLLALHRQKGVTWDQYLRYLCNTGPVYHSPEMFEFFLTLIDDGTLDDLRPGFAVNDDWWSVLYGMAESHPDLASVAIGHWFDRVVARSEAEITDVDVLPYEDAFAQRILEKLDQSQGGSGTGVIFKAASACCVFAEQLLPRVASVIERITLKVDLSGSLSRDRIWGWRFFGDNPHSVHESILKALAHALEVMANSNPTELANLIEPYSDRSEDALVYLVLRAWTAAPEVFGSRLADYLLADSRRLEVGYMGGGGGDCGSWRSVQAIAKAHANGRADQRESLERLVMDLRDSWEQTHPKERGFRQLKLLEAMEPNNMGKKARSRLWELRRKFPGEKLQPPRPIEACWIGSPIPEDAQSKMSDGQWLKAMVKYAHTERARKYGAKNLGGERHLAQALEGQVQRSPKRFLQLALQMPNSLPASYFSAILRGIASCDQTPCLSSPIFPNRGELEDLIKRVHALPGQLCGDAILWLIRKCKDSNWSDAIIEIVIWYALHDPSPSEDVWVKQSEGGQSHNGWDIQMEGINSTRGVAAETIAYLLFERPGSHLALLDAVHALATDRNLAVRSCAIETLTALLNHDEKKAIDWFLEGITDQCLFGQHSVERFLGYASYRSYSAIRPFLMRMLESQESNVVEAASRRICLLALDEASAQEDAERIRIGTEPMRHAAADVYAANIGHEVVGQQCLSLLKQFFQDPSEKVRSEAANGFQNIAKLTTHSQETLLECYLGSSQHPSDLGKVVKALEDSIVQLPDLVCSVAEACINQLGPDASDPRKAGIAVAMDISKIVIRLYTQTADSDIQRRCLDLIDTMEMRHFYGIDAAMELIER